MSTRMFHGTGGTRSALPGTASVGGSAPPADVASSPCAASPPSSADLTTLFAMRDLGMSGVVGGRRPEALSLDREARVSGSTAPAQAGERTAPPRTIALSDGTRITFINADRLTEPA